MFNNSEDKIISNQDTELVIDTEKDVLKTLFNKKTKTDWLVEPCSLYKTNNRENVKIDFDIVSLANKNIELSLKITNISSTPVNLKTWFPILSNINPENKSNKLCYFFPQNEPIINDEVTKLCKTYSYVFPFQFINVFHKNAGSITLMTLDKSNFKKDFCLEKRKNGQVDFGVKYFNKTILPDETWVLPEARLIIHKGDWHQGLLVYRDWLNSFYNPSKPRKRWLLESFIFRQHFLHENYGDRAWLPQNNEYSLNKLVAKDIDLFGGVDYVQLFDWAYEPNYGRVGNYKPWNYLGGHEKLKNEINKIQKKGIKVGLYIEGYLVNRESEIVKEEKELWSTKDTGGSPYYRWGGKYIHPCPFIEDWQKIMTNICIDANDKLEVDGFYIDEFGNGTQYPCYSKKHGHDIPANQLLGEEQMISHIRKKLTDDIVILSEYCPTDISTQFQEGSLTYANSLINIFRFIIPDFKIFVILECDNPLSNLHVEEAKKVFFNGLGSWISGPVSNNKWFPEKYKCFIKKSYKILKKYKDAFTSENPLPLVDTLHPLVLANKFPGINRTVWTLFNKGTEDISGEILKVEHQQNSTYFDAWNNCDLDVRIEKEFAYIKLKLEEKEVGCVAQEVY